MIGAAAGEGNVKTADAGCVVAGPIIWPPCQNDCALAVILGFMSDTKHVVLIHGSWARGDSWGPALAAFEQRGYPVPIPTLRHRELLREEGAMKIAPLSLRDYTDDLVALVDSLDSPPRATRHHGSDRRLDCKESRARHHLVRSAE
jgi:pimeloyl-ACP methyl ester carboxylesterase